MTTRQENEYSRNNGLANYLGTHAAQLASLPHFNTTLSGLQAANVQINLFAKKQQDYNGNAGRSKSQLRAAIVAMVADYLRKLKAYSTFENNGPLLSDVLAAEKVFRTAPDTEFSNLCKGIAEKSEANLSALAEYGITAETQIALTGLIEEYDAVITAPREAIASLKENNASLLAAFTESRTFIKKLDIIMAMVKTTMPDIYAGYKAAHKIVNSGEGQLSLKGKVTDTATGLPLQSVIITLQAQPAIPGFTKITKKSTALGGFTAKGMPQGTYLVTAVYPSYVTQAITTSIYDGQLTTLNIQLQKG